MEEKWVAIYFVKGELRVWEGDREDSIVEAIWEGHKGDLIELLERDNASI